MAKRKHPKGKRLPAQKFSHEEREAIFKFWATSRSPTATAKKFNTKSSVISRLITQHGWVKRYEAEILPKLQKKGSKEAVKQIISNIEIVRKLKEGVVRLVAERIKNKSLDVTLKDVGDLIKLEIMLTSDAPIETENDNRGHAMTVIQQNLYLNVTEATKESERITRRLRKLAQENLDGDGVQLVQAENISGESVSKHIRGTGTVESGRPAQANPAGDIPRRDS